MFLHPFLKIGATLASNQSWGRLPVSSDWENIAARPGASSDAISFRKIFGMLSGPDALDVFMLVNSFIMPPRLISICAIFGICVGGKLGNGSF